MGIESIIEVDQCSSMTWNNTKGRDDGSIERFTKPVIPMPTGKNMNHEVDRS